MPKSSYQQAIDVLASEIYELSELVKCPICSKIVNFPVKLECKHIFCEKCTEKCLKNNNLLTCPVCHLHASKSSKKRYVESEGLIKFVQKMFVQFKQKFNIDFASYAKLNKMNMAKKSSDELFSELVGRVTPKTYQRANKSNEKSSTITKEADVSTEMKEYVIEWLQDSQNLFTRISQTQQLDIPTPSTSKVNIGNSLISASQQKKRRKTVPSEVSTLKAQEPMKRRCKSLGSRKKPLIQRKSERISARLTKGSKKVYLKDSEDLREMQIEEIDSEPPDKGVTAKKVDDSLNLLQKQQKDREDTKKRKMNKKETELDASHNTSNWGRIKKINKSINKVECRPKRLKVETTSKNEDKTKAALIENAEHVDSKNSDVSEYSLYAPSFVRADLRSKPVENVNSNKKNEGKMKNLKKDTHLGAKVLREILNTQNPELEIACNYGRVNQNENTKEHDESQFDQVEYEERENFKECHNKLESGERGQENVEKHLISKANTRVDGRLMITKGEKKVEDIKKVKGNAVENRQIIEENENDSPDSDMFIQATQILIDPANESNYIINDCTSFFQTFVRLTRKLEAYKAVDGLNTKLLHLNAHFNALEGKFSILQEILDSDDGACLPPLPLTSTASVQTEKEFKIVKMVQTDISNQNKEVNTSIKEFKDSFVQTSNDSVLQNSKISQAKPINFEKTTQVSLQNSESTRKSTNKESRNKKLQVQSHVQEETTQTPKKHIQKAMNTQKTQTPSNKSAEKNQISMNNTLDYMHFDSQVIGNTIPTNKSQKKRRSQIRLTEIFEKLEGINDTDNTTNKCDEKTARENSDDEDQNDACDLAELREILNRPLESSTNISGKKLDDLSLSPIRNPKKKKRMRISDDSEEDDEAEPRNNFPCVNVYKRDDVSVCFDTETPNELAGSENVDKYLNDVYDRIEKDYLNVSAVKKSPQKSVANRVLPTKNAQESKAHTQELLDKCDHLINNTLTKYANKNPFPSLQSPRQLMNLSSSTPIGLNSTPKVPIFHSSTLSSIKKSQNISLKDSEQVPTTSMIKPLQLFNEEEEDMFDAFETPPIAPLDQVEMQSTKPITKKKVETEQPITLLESIVVRTSLLDDEFDHTICDSDEDMVFSTPESTSKNQRNPFKKNWETLDETLEPPPGFQDDDDNVVESTEKTDDKIDETVKDARTIIGNDDTLKSDRNYLTRITSTPIVNKKQTKITSFIQTPKASVSSTNRRDLFLKQEIPKQPTISCTRLGSDQIMAINALTYKKLATYSSVFSESVTHMVVATDESNCIKDHTIKYISAVAAGIWVVNFKWIEDCLKLGKIMPEESYEVLDVSGVPGPKNSRLYRTVRPLLKGFKIHVYPPFSSTTKSDVEKIVTLLGAVTVPTPQKLLPREDYICLIITEAKDTQGFELYENWVEELKVISVDIEWLSRSVGQYKLLSLLRFALCADDSITDLGYPPELLQHVPFSFTQADLTL